MLKIIVMLTAMTANGPITAEVATVGPFATAAQCQAFGDAVKPLADAGVRALLAMAFANEAGFGEVQPLYIETDDAKTAVAFRCAPAEP